MKQSTLISLSLTILLLYTASCIKEQMVEVPTLPPITMEGANTFGCLVNGEVFVPEGNFGFANGDPLQIYYAYPDGGFNISARRRLEADIPTMDHTWKVDRRIAFISEFVQIGSFPVTDGGGDIYVDYLSARQYYLDTSKLHTVKIIHLNLSERIISGTFEFTAITEDLQDTVRITEGRFDVEF